MQVIRRVGLIGDLHAEHETLAFVVSELNKLGVDTLLQVGDIADGPGDLSQTVALLQRHQVLAVRGNHDRWLTSKQMRDLPYAHELARVEPMALEFLEQLPATRQFRSPRGHVLLCHGLGSNDMAGVRPDHEGSQLASNADLQQLITQRRFRFVLNGHTHRAMLRTFGSLSIVNAGTLLRDHERCFTLVDFERGELQRFRHASGALSLNLADWLHDRQALADSPSEPFREPFA